ncbi:MAG: ABC transporter ATP-binding protein [Lachnospiraceae bacterium]|nr:ABC transporter ATP-binding protein [Lachnospiraceae bacterium]
MTTLTNETAAIAVQDIKKSFGKNEAKTDVLQGVSFQIPKGEFVSLMGASGSGKSTLLYLIGGLDRNYTGDIYINGSNISKMKERDMTRLRLDTVGFVFQFYNLVQNLSVEDNIMLPIVMSKKKNTAEYRKKLDEILEITGLTAKRKSKPGQLSGGQQQRVAIARAVLANPEIILADEPTGNLDQKAGNEIMELFRRVNKEKGITILMVTHSPQSAAYADRVIVLENGKMKEETRTEQAV